MCYHFDKYGHTFSFSLRPPSSFNDVSVLCDVYLGHDCHLVIRIFVSLEGVKHAFSE